MTLWNAVQAKLPKRGVGQRKHGRRRSFVYRLKGLVRCGACGGHMTTAAGTGRNGVHWYYKCTKVYDGSKRCSVRSVPARTLEEVVSNRIQELNRNPEIVRHEGQGLEHLPVVELAHRGHERQHRGSHR